MRNRLKVLIGLGVVVGGALLTSLASRGAVPTTSNPMLMSAEEFARVHRLEAAPNTMYGALILTLILTLLLPIVLVALRRIPRTSRSPIIKVSAVTIGALLLVIALGAVNQSAMAFGSYGSLVPNYGASIATNPNGTHCNLCHAEGGDKAADTPFKLAFANANHLWTVALAQADSDGDGFSNGEELQDPNGATVGNTAAADPYGDTAFQSSPAIATATFVNDNTGFGTRGYPIPPIVAAMSLVNGQTIAGSSVVSAGIRYAGLSKEVWTVTNSGGTLVYSSTINYAPLSGTNYNNKHCLGANAPTAVCGVWDSTVLPNGNYTIMVTAYDRRAASLGGPQTHSLSRLVTINNVTASNADLSISKSASSASVLVGSPLTYTLVVANAGPLAASNVKVTDTLPAGVTLTSVSSTAGACTGTSTVVCSISSLANGGSATVTLVVTAEAAGNVNNTATVSADEPDPNPGNNSSSAATTVGAPAADVSVAKSASAGAVSVNSPFTYTIVVRNNGPLAATNVVMTDALPAGLSMLSTAATLGACSGSTTIVCTIGPLANGGDATVSLGVMAALTGTVDNTAQVSADQIDSNLANNQSTATVVVGNQVPSDLSASRKFASKNTVHPDDAVTYTIQLVNTGTTAATLNVTDPVPALMQYVDGSASGNGVYDPASRTLSWTGVMVPAGQQVPLSFVARATTVASSTLVVNVATINDGTTSFERQAPVVIVPPGMPMPHPKLAGARKSVSRHHLTYGEVLTYTIKLHNSGTADASVDVVDPVPAGLSYLPGTANAGGLYDPGTKTLTWSAITVPSGSRVNLSFAVTATLTVTRPTRIVNTATIKVAGDGTFTRTVRVKLAPISEKDDDDEIDPKVDRSTIGDGDVLTNRAVTLHISATDDVGVKSMYLREWELATSPSPHWAVIHSSGWIPYQADYPWTLDNTSGVHFVSAWVADGAGDISPLDRGSLDFASLVLPNATVPRRGVVPYLVYYPAGVNVKATLTSRQGDADLYVWYPGNFFLPDQTSTHPSTAADAVTFTTPRAGVYLFVVHGYAAATYDLNITPGGGPQAGPMMTTPVVVSSAAPVGPFSSNATKPDGLVLEPVLSQSGVDPLSDAVDPSGLYGVYLPLVIR